MVAVLLNFVIYSFFCECWLQIVILDSYKSLMRTANTRLKNGFFSIDAITASSTLILLVLFASLFL